MAATRSTIDIVIRGSLSGLTRAVAGARATLGALESQAKSLDTTAAKAGAAMAVLGTGIAALSGNVGGVVSGVKILNDFGTALGHLPDGADRLPSVVQRIIQVSAAVGLFTGGAQLLARVTAGLSGIGAVTGALGQFGSVVERLTGPLRFVASAATGFLTVLKGFQLIKTVIPYFEKFSTALAGVNVGIKAVQGLVAVLKQLAPALLLVPGALSILGATFATVKLGLSGFGDAVKKGGADLAKLAPEARATAQALRDMAPAAHEVQQAVQNELFKGLSTEVQKLGRTFLPQLKASLASIATPLNGMARGFLQVANSGQSLDQVTGILDDTQTALSGIEPAAGNVLQAFLKLASAGTAKFGGLGTAIANVTAKFRDWANALVDSGRFDTFVARAIQGFRQLGGIVGNIGAIIRTVFQGLAGSGPSDPLGSLLALTAAVRGFFESVQGQAILNTLAELLQHAGENAARLGDVFLNNILPAIQSFLPFLERMSTAINEGLVAGIRVVTPIFQVLGEVLSALAPALGPIVTAMVFMGTAAAGLGLAAKIASGALLIFRTAALGLRAIEGVIGIIGRLTGQMRLAAAAGNLIKGGVIAAGLYLIADGLDKVNLAAAGGDPSKLNDMDHSLHNIVGAAQEIASGDFAGIFNQINAQLDQTNQKWRDGQAPIQQWFDKVKTSFQNDFVGALTGAGAAVNQFITDTGTAIGTGVSTWFAGVRESFQRDFLDVFAALPGQIGTIFANIGTTIATTASNLWTGFLTVVQAQFAPVIAFFSQTPFQMGVAIGSGIGAIVSAALNLMTAFGTAVNQGITNVLTFFTALPGQIAVSLAQLGTTIFTTVTTAMTNFGTAVNQGITNVINFFTGMPAQVGGAIAPIPGVVVGVAVNAGTGFLTNVTNFFNNAVAFLSTIPGRAVSAIASIVGFMIQKATEMGQGFLNAATSIFNNVISFIAGIPGRIVSALGNLGSLLVNAGRSVIDGLLSGIRAGVQAMYDFVSGIAAGIAARKGPISYDRTVLRPAGLALMEGLLGGIKDGNDDVQSFVGTIADQLARSASGTGLIATAARFAAPSSGAGANGGLGITSTSAPLPVTIPIHIGDEVVRVVRTEIDTSNRDVRRTVRAGAGVTAG